MLQVTRKDPVVDNPFRQVGLSGVALADKTFEQAVSLARSIARALRESPSVKNEVKLRATRCMDELADPARAHAYFQAFKGLTPDAVIARLVVRANERQKQYGDELYAAWLYTLERGAPASLHNGVRMSPATVEVTDIVSMLQSPIRENSAIARKLFKRTLKSLGDGRIEHGVELPGGNETHRETIGVLHLNAPNRPITFEDVEKVIRDLGLINSSSRCIEHYDLSAAAGLGHAQKVGYPKPQHAVFSHFHPTGATERLLAVNSGDVQGGLRAQIPKTTPSSCNILLSRVTIGTIAAVCIEGIIESVTALPESRPARTNARASSLPEGRTTKKSAKASPNKKEPSPKPRAPKRRKSEKGE